MFTSGKCHKQKVAYVRYGETKYMQLSLGSYKKEMGCIRFWLARRFGQIWALDCRGFGILNGKRPGAAGAPF